MRQLTSVLKKAGVGAFALSIMAFTASAQQVISLQKAVDLALQNNLTVKQSAFNEAFDETIYQQSKYNQLPSLSSNVGASQNFGRAIDFSTNQYTSRNTFGVNGGINLSMILFQGGALRNTIVQNRLQLDVDKSNTTKIKNDLTLSVIIAYLQILTNQDVVAAAQQQIDVAKINLDRTDKTVKAGNQTMADLSQARANLATAEYNLTNAQNQLEISILTLKQYMEIPATSQIAVVRPDISQFTDVKSIFNAEDVYKSAVSVNPDVKLAEARQAVSAQSIKVAKAGFYPSLSLGSGLSSNYSNAQSPRAVTNPVTGAVTFEPYLFGPQISDHFAQNIGLNLQIPIFNRFSARTSVKRATINFQNAQISTQIAKNNLSKTIYQAVVDARGAANQFLSAQQTYQANKDAFNVIQQRYNVGLENSLNYNTSLTNLNRSQFDLIQAQYNMIFRSKVIDYYLGNPINL